MIFYPLVKTDKVGVDVAQQRFSKTRVEGDYASSEKRLNPASSDCWCQGLNPRDQLGLNALALNRRNNYSHGTSSVLTFFFAVIVTILLLSPRLKSKKSSIDLIGVAFPFFMRVVTP